MIDWNTTEEEFELIKKIASRADQIYRGWGMCKIMMDIETTHCNGCKLRLSELLEANEFDFCHDVSGIDANLNRETGELENCFLPRYAAY